MNRQANGRWRTMGALLLVFFMSGCAAMQPTVTPPQLNLIDVQFLDARLLEQRYELTFRVLNPNDLDIPIQGMYFELQLEARPFATGVSSKPVTVPAYGETEVVVTVSTNVLKTVTQLADFLKGQPQSVSYRLSGHLKVDLPLASRLPVSSEGTLRLSPKPE
jgi:LEA14-like dessication related protein